jgi:sugar/nucleoside kinase (ribokinase family)
MSQPEGPSLLVGGEVLVEIMRPGPGQPLGEVGEFRGPFASGAPAIAARTAAGLGVATAFVGCVGDDAFGRSLLARLAADGVEVSSCRIVPDRPTGSAFVAYDDRGGREFVFNVEQAACGQVRSGDLGDLPAHASWLHVSGSSLFLGRGLAEAVMAAARAVSAAGGRISFDPNIRGTVRDPERLADLRWLGEHAALVLPTGNELTQLGVTEDELVERGALVCTTNGADGARVRTAAGEIAVTAPTVAEVDPTGAGDTFAGALLAAIIAMSSADGALPALPDLAVAVGRACAVAAASVAVFGPMEVDLASVGRA